MIGTDKTGFYSQAEKSELICYIVFAKNNDSITRERYYDEGNVNIFQRGLRHVREHMSSLFIFKPSSKGGKKDGQEKKLMGFYV